MQNDQIGRHGHEGQPYDRTGASMDRRAALLAMPSASSARFFRWSLIVRDFRIRAYLRDSRAAGLVERGFQLDGPERDGYPFGDGIAFNPAN